MNDCLLEVLGDYFVKHDLVNKGWEFHELLLNGSEELSLCRRGDLSGP